MDSKIRNLFIYSIDNIFKKITSISLVSLKEFFFFKKIQKTKKIGWQILRTLKFIKFKKIQNIQSQLFFKKFKLKFDDYCYLNPKKIQYWLEGNFNKFNNYSKLSKRSWEKKDIPFNDSIIAQSFKRRFKEKKAWRETEFYPQVLNEISRGIIKWGCNDKREFEEWLKELDLLYSQIKEDIEKLNNNFKSYKEVFDKLRKQNNFYEVDAVINEAGHILIYNGILILLIALLLDIPKVPICITARHKEWQKLKKRLLYMTKVKHKVLYQKLLHPDLQNLPYRHGDFRYDLIKRFLSVSKGSLLDIGSNYGYFCHNFEDDGFDCFAVEFNPKNLYFMKKLKIAENKKFKIIPDSIFNYKRNQKIVVDVVLALNIFHHFLKTKSSYFNLIKLLKRLEVKELFFRAHHPESFQKIKVYQNYNPDQFVNFLIENSCLNSSKLIEEIKHGRSLYKLTSE